MRKLKLQVQMSVDGYIAGPNGEMDWMIWNWDEEIKNYVTNLTESVDCIVLGRKLAEGFIGYWEGQYNDPATIEDARKLHETPKVVFTNTIKENPWNNASLAHNLITDIKKLKEGNGKDIIAYGGGTFVSSLIKEGLIDEFYLFVNPTILGKGMPIFEELDNRQNLKLLESKSFACGITVLHYTK
ncbi:dihydrofolate reductase [Flavobacterium alkalisoli]|uniref:Dihydrofolate reductase n=1 Tax=Flavobacterium alkalisoli TaxID=2602769 RepID=A0A5B9FLX2_9FLAO|nr:dihydrofolate reductase family protein [Flavobacterium alkalisoli]QEE48233.1 dihydrofolate reductase [Flavobacterium alkalisoli]